MEIPVYIFTGFLESGKTMFIQDTLEDKRFNSGEKTLVLVCEDGEEEYNPGKYYGKNVFFETVEEQDTLTEEYLNGLIKKTRAERVIVEYNGMWMLQPFYDAMPEGWIPYQDMLFFDSTTFANYNANMRGLVADKITNADVIIFNRIPDGADIMPYHKAVRPLSRRANIIYEFKDGHIQNDEIVDPLPFDINASVIQIEDRDFAFFYQDLMTEMKKYNGKTVKFKGVAAKTPKFPDNSFAIGRHIMTCCAADITYCGIVSVANDATNIVSGAWYTLTAAVNVKFSRLYGKKGPVLTVKSLERAIEPDESVATFY